METKRRQRQKKTVIAQITVRLYSGVPLDESLFAAFDPLACGMLRLTVMEALRLGVEALRLQGWPLGDAVSPVQVAKPCDLPPVKKPVKTPEQTPVKTAEQTAEQAAEQEEDELQAQRDEIRRALQQKIMEHDQ